MTPKNVIVDLIVYQTIKNNMLQGAISKISSQQGTH